MKRAGSSNDGSETVRDRKAFQVSSYLVSWCSNQNAWLLYRNRVLMPPSSSRKKSRTSWFSWLAPRQAALKHQATRRCTLVTSFIRGDRTGHARQIHLEAVRILSVCEPRSKIRKYVEIGSWDLRLARIAAVPPIAPMPPSTARSGWV
jgi:hypothetical protein